MKLNWGGRVEDKSESEGMVVLCSFYVPFNGLEEIVRVSGSGELAVEVVGSVRRDIEPKNGP